jgi:hypothetical protein
MGRIELPKSLFFVLGLLLAIAAVFYFGAELRSISVGPFEFEIPDTPVIDNNPVDTEVSPPLPATNTPTIIIVTQTEPSSEVDLGEWMIVVGGGFSNYNSAWGYLKQYQQFGYPTQVFYRKNDIRTAIVGFPSQYDAEITLPDVQKRNKDAYLRSVSEWCPNQDWNPDYIECE